MVPGENLGAASVDAMWRGAIVVTPTTTQMREITWELATLGFRVELEYLDRHLRPAGGDVDEVLQQETRRRMQVSRVFGGRSLLTPHGVHTDGGLSSPDARARAGRLEALRKLMVEWPDIHADVKACPVLTQTTPVPTIEAAEKVLCAHYTQTFFNCAGRAATIPRLLP